MVKENLQQIESRIQSACARANRNREDVTLICVTKTKPIDMLQEAYDENQREFGENKVQEICRKYPELPSDIHWHMIGHLQRNKVKMLIGKTVMIHSVDNIPLAETISKEAVKAGLVVPILIEVNVAREESKYGVRTEEVLPLVKEISALPSIEVHGLMTIAPYTEDPESNRPYFRKLRQLSVDITKECIDNVTMNVLSMGMTGDFEVAIEEGATHVRVGTGIFGERHYI